MGTTTVRRLAPQRPTPTTYWRRRFFVLVTSLAAFVLVAWVASGLLGGSRPLASRSAIKTAHRAVTSPTGRPPASVIPTPARTTSKPDSTPTHTVSPARHRPQHTARPAPCQAADVVLSLFTNQLSYSLRQPPEFQVDVVSTASQTCTFDIGSRHLWLQISSGKAKVWSSAQCAEGQASLVTELHRGVPTVVTIGWNVHASSAGCPVPGAPARRGTYTAQAKDGLTASNPITFRIT